MYNPRTRPHARAYTDCSLVKLYTSTFTLETNMHTVPFCFTETPLQTNKILWEQPGVCPALSLLFDTMLVDAGMVNGMLNELANLALRCRIVE
jgi:hypothetical protein